MRVSVRPIAKGAKPTGARLSVAYPHVGKSRGENGAPATAKHQPKSSDKLGAKLSRQRHE